MGIHFGIHLANSGPKASAEALRTLAQRADALGYDSIWVSDHVVIPMRFASRYPYPGRFTPESAGIYYEPLMTLAVLAGATRRVQLGTSVLVVPQRNPVLTGKQLGTLAALAGGRLIVGVGVGWLAEEFELLEAGHRFRARGAVTDEYVGLYRVLWRDDPAVFEGSQYALPPVRALPHPPTMPPVWVGGNTKPAVRRAARIGDGWHAIRIGVAEVRDGIAYLRERLAAEGRPVGGVTVSLRVHLHLDRPSTQEWELGPTMGDVLGGLERYRDAGVDAFIFSMPADAGIEHAVESAERFAADARPQLPG